MNIIMKITKLFIIIFLSLWLNGCAALGGFVSHLFNRTTNGGTHITATVPIGDNKKTANINTANKTTSYKGTKQIIENNYGMAEWKFWLILGGIWLIFWELPQPHKGFTGFWKKLRKKK